MAEQLTLGSLFDGSGGFPLGGILAGIVPVWASEIEPFAVRVTTKRMPFLKHCGDVSALSGAELPPVDIITFGSPCQDMSVAGKRAGLDGSRSNLFYEAVRIIKEMRNTTNGEKPRYLVWENVPGAFSSNGGEDFKAVLDAIRRIKDHEADTPRPAKWPNAGCILADDHSIAWRVFDAQYWGVPQRRKRIYLVADLADRCAGKILFESEGLSGYTPQGFRSWQSAAGSAEDGAGKTGCLCLNDQGGERMDVSENVTATLRAEAHHPPVVTEAAGFCTEHSARSRSIGYDEETSPTLRAGTVPAAVYENHSQDTRYTGPINIAPTVMSTYGTGGNNQPFVVHAPKTLKIRAGCEGGGKGPLIQEDRSATLSCNNDQTVFVPRAFGICSKDSNSMRSDNPHSGFYEAETTRTLDANGGNPSCNQGGMAVVAFAQNQRDEVRDLNGKAGCLAAEPGAKQQTYVLQGSMIGRGDENGPQGSGVNEDVSFTLDATDRHAVAYGIDRAAYNQGQNAKFDPCIETEVEPPMLSRGPGAVAHPVFSTSKNSYHVNAEENLANTLVATDYKDPPTVTEDPYYIVRRLTPVECARLQGFPDWWCAGLETDEPTEEDIAFWRDVFETHRRITGSAAKPKSDAQIVKWLKAPHSDSAEYKLWGNGVALPCVFFVLAGIVYYTQNTGA